MRELVRVGGAISLEEKMLGQVAAHRGRCAGDDFGGRMVACLEHAFAAQHLESLIVAVCRATARVDLAELASFGADGNRRAIRVAGFGDRRIDEAGSVGVHGLRVVVENPAENVEVVDQHVLEDAARASDVRDRRRARIAARDDQHFRRADLALDDARLQRRESRVVAALESDEACDARAFDGVCARACALEIEVDRLFAKDLLARAGRRLNQVRVGVGGRADQYGLDVLVIERLGDGRHSRAATVGKRLRVFRVRIDHVLEPCACLLREVARVDAADPSGAEECDIDHGGSLVDATIAPR